MMKLKRKISEVSTCIKKHFNYLRNSGVCDFKSQKTKSNYIPKKLYLFIPRNL